MGLWRTLAGSLLHRGGGFWSYMTERTKSRTAIELERERNAATANVIPLLPPGIDFMESEDGGRTRVIRTAPQTSPDSTTEAPPTPSSPLPVNEPDTSAPARLALQRADGGSAPITTPHGRQDNLPVSEPPR